MICVDLPSLFSSKFVELLVNYYPAFSVRHLEYLTKILPSSFQIFQDLANISQDLPRSCHDLASSGKIFAEIQDRIQDLVKISKMNPRSCQDIQDEIQDLTKKSKIDSKNIFVEHVVLLQAVLPETERILILRRRLSAVVI